MPNRRDGSRSLYLCGRGLQELQFLPGYGGVCDHQQYIKAAQEDPFGCFKMLNVIDNVTASGVGSYLGVLQYRINVSAQRVLNTENDQDDVAEYWNYFFGTLCSDEWLAELTASTAPSTMVKHGSHLRGSILAAMAMNGGRNRGRGLKLYVLRQRDSWTSKSRWISSSPVKDTILCEKKPTFCRHHWTGKSCFCSCNAEITTNTDTPR